MLTAPTSWQAPANTQDTLLVRQALAAALRHTDKEFRSWFSKAAKTWKTARKLFAVRPHPTSEPRKTLPLPTLPEVAWMRLGSWTFCPRCGQRRPQGKLHPGWTRKSVAQPCCTKNCHSLTPLQALPHVVPQLAHWPHALLHLDASDFQELPLLDIKVDFRAVRGGRSPVTSLQKLSVCRGQWRSHLPREDKLSALGRKALAWLLENCASYRRFWEGTQGSAADSGTRAVVAHSEASLADSRS